MLKYRLIFGFLFSALFVGIISLDEFMSRGWPGRHWSAPAGMMVAILMVIVVPMALYELRQLLARQNVQIALRIVTVAAMMCMLWPWLEQIAEQVLTREEGLRRIAATQRMGTESTILQALNASPWHTVAQWFRTVKPHYLVPTVLTASLVAAFALHSRKRQVEGAMASAGGTLLAVVYLGVLPGFFLPICITHSAWMMLAVIGIVKCADIGAYVTGHAIGRHKLIPWLSPGKTVEGFVGGLVWSAAVGAAVAVLFAKNVGPQYGEFTWPKGLVAGALLGAVGQLGDLLESLLKRDAGVKDSGAVPGFGGVLDILDSPLLAAPVAYWLLKLVAHTA